MSVIVNGVYESSPTSPASEGGSQIAASEIADGSVAFASATESEAQTIVQAQTNAEFQNSLSALSALIGSETSDLERDFGEIIQGLSAALNEDVQIVVTANEDVAAADLNAAAAGTFLLRFSAELRTSGGSTLLRFAGMEPVITPGVTAVDVDILAPTESGTAKFSNGILDVTLIVDTDAGATKTYQAGDEITCDVDLSGFILFAGVAVGTKTFDVV